MGGFKRNGFKAICPSQLPLPGSSIHGPQTPPPVADGGLPIDFGSGHPSASKKLSTLYIIERPAGTTAREEVSGILGQVLLESPNIRMELCPSGNPWLTRLK